MHVVPVNLSTFIKGAENTNFPIQNLPYGVFSSAKIKEPKLGIAIGDLIFDLSAAAQAGWINTVPIATLQQPTLNALASLGRATWTALRAEVASLLQNGSKLSKTPNVDDLFLKQSDATMHLPFDIKGFTDFYASENHAYNCGSLFRDPENALPPNWKHIPIGYNGRLSSINLGNLPIIRPNGQIIGSDGPTWGPTKSLDFELEIGVFIGKDTVLGEPLPISEAQDAIFGLVLLNDWSARDIQRWEYAPLGPFQAKAFHTSISPWVVPLDALQPFRCRISEQQPSTLPYLEQADWYSYDIQLDVMLKSSSASENTIISHSNLKYLYWTFEQMIAHQSSSGCNLRVGDLIGTGTISGPTKDSLGCMLEITRNGQVPLRLTNGEVRKFLEDGDVLTFSGKASKDGVSIGFGCLQSNIAPAISYP